MRGDRSVRSFLLAAFECFLAIHTLFAVKSSFLFAFPVPETRREVFQSDARRRISLPVSTSFFGREAPGSFLATSLSFGVELRGIALLAIFPDSLCVSWKKNQ
jgi:hypothetical protein